MSRDTFDHLSGDEFTLVHYVARQSLISATTPPLPAPDDLPRAQSSFQQRMLEGDLAGNALSLLARRAEDVDLVLLDLADERLGVVRRPGERFVTRSTDSLGTPLGELLYGADTDHIPFGTPAHFQLWSGAVDQLVALLDTLGLTQRTLVLAPAWAERSNDGCQAPSSFGVPANVANLVYASYHEHLESVGLTVARPPSGTEVADPQHKWGAAPFHYTSATYGALVGSIREFAAHLPLRHRGIDSQPTAEAARFTALRHDDDVITVCARSTFLGPRARYAFYAMTPSGRVANRPYGPDPVWTLDHDTAVRTAWIQAFTRLPGTDIVSTPVSVARRL